MAAILGIVAFVLVGGFVFYATQNQSMLPSPDNNDVAPSSTDNGQAIAPPDVLSQGEIPIAVTNSRVDSTDTTVVLTGTVTPNGAFTNYWYEYSASPDFKNKMSILSQSIGSGFISISAPGYITGLVKDTTYYFRLVAENEFGRVMGAEYSFQTSQGNPPHVGSAPTIKTLAASNISRTVAKLNGEATPNGASTQYWFEYGKTVNLGNITPFVSIGEGVAKVPASISLSNLEPATTYYFRLDAQNQFGTVISEVLNFKTPGPAAEPKK